MIRNKFTFIHSPYNKNLICVETKEEVCVELPPLIPISTYGERVKESEEKAKEEYIETFRRRMKIQ